MIRRKQRGRDPVQMALFNQEVEKFIVEGDENYDTLEKELLPFDPKVECKQCGGEEFDAHATAQGNLVFGGWGWESPMPKGMTEADLAVTSEIFEGWTLHLSQHGWRTRVRLESKRARRVVLMWNCKRCHWRFGPTRTKNDKVDL